MSTETGFSFVDLNPAPHLERLHPVHIALVSFVLQRFHHGWHTRHSDAASGSRFRSMSVVPICGGSPSGKAAKARLRRLVQTFAKMSRAPGQSR